MLLNAHRNVNFLIRHVSGRPCECIWQPPNTLNLSVTDLSNYTHHFLPNTLKRSVKYTQPFSNTLTCIVKYTHGYCQIHLHFYPNTLLFLVKYTLFCFKYTTFFIQIQYWFIQIPSLDSPNTLFVVSFVAVKYTKILSKYTLIAFIILHIIINTIVFTYRDILIELYYIQLFFV